MSTPKDPATLVRHTADTILAPILTDEVTKKISLATEKAIKVKALVAAYKITSDDEEQKAAAALKMIHAELKALEEERKTLAEPLTKAKAAVDARYRGPKNDLDAAKTAIGIMLGKYAAEKARAKALLVAQSTEDASTPEERRALIVAGTEQAPKLEGLREVVTYEVRCVAPEKVAREFLIPDVDKAKEVIAASEGKVVPAGFAFERVVRMVPTGKG